MPAGTRARDYVRTNILAPIGGRYDLYGVWQPVKVVSLPACLIADVFVMPSVRTQQLTVRLTLRNDTASPQSVGDYQPRAGWRDGCADAPGPGAHHRAPLTNAQFDITAPGHRALLEPSGPLPLPARNHRQRRRRLRPGQHPVRLSRILGQRRQVLFERHPH